MSRLWSRFGVRAISVVLLLVGVAGGVYLSQDRQIQQQGIDAQLAAQADRAEQQVLQEQQSAHAAAIAPQREAEAEAAAKAASVGKAAAARAEKAKAVVSRQERPTPPAGAADDGVAETGQAAKPKPEPKPKPFTGPIPKSCNEYSGTRKIGCAILVGKGMGMDQMGCLDRLWKKESGWNPRAENRSSGAYGIPQAMPGRKMASAGANWKTDAATQIRWGLGYIKGRYGNPCGAWNHSKRTGWY